MTTMCPMDVDPGGRSASVSYNQANYSMRNRRYMTMPISTSGSLPGGAATAQTVFLLTKLCPTPSMTSCLRPNTTQERIGWCAHAADGADHINGSGFATSATVAAVK